MVKKSVQCIAMVCATEDVYRIWRLQMAKKQYTWQCIVQWSEYVHCTQKIECSTWSWWKFKKLLWRKCLYILTLKALSWSGLRQFLTTESPLRIMTFFISYSFRSEDISVFDLTFWSKKIRLISKLLHHSVVNK